MCVCSCTQVGDWHQNIRCLYVATVCIVDRLSEHACNDTTATSTTRLCTPTRSACMRVFLIHTILNCCLYVIILLALSFVLILWPNLKHLTSVNRIISDLINNINSLLESIWTITTLQYFTNTCTVSYS